MELFWNSLDNSPGPIVFYKYLEMKVEAEVGVHDIRSRFTPRGKYCNRSRFFILNEIL